MKPLSVLVVDDEAIIRDEIVRFLTRAEYEAFEAATPSAAFALLESTALDIVILDVKLPETDGLTVLRTIKKNEYDVEVIMITGHGDRDTLLAALAEGAFDFFHKPFRLFDLKASIERTNKYRMLAKTLEKTEARYAYATEQARNKIGDIIAESPAMKEVLALAMRAAEYADTPVIIEGASGTGKELIARAIHFTSPRANEVFLPVNCSAIPDELIESEFFGHRKGAFTGADTHRAGVFEAADGGTLFLDEIGDMPLRAQAKLLRVLETKKVKRVGDTREQAVDVRVISATNKDLAGMVSEGTFRQDLFFRLNTIVITVPPLAQRPEDVSPLIDYYVAHYKARFKFPLVTVDAAVYDALKVYSFPGNVRELRNIVERAMILSGGNTLTLAHFPKTARAEEKSFHERVQALNELRLSVVERELIIIALDRANGNKSEAARLLEISRHTLDRLIRQYDVSH